MLPYITGILSKVSSMSLFCIKLKIGKTNTRIRDNVIQKQTESLNMANSDDQ